MKILIDQELIAIVDEKNPRCAIQNVKKPIDWFSKNSPVQPTSIDLTIGSIKVPKVDDNKKNNTHDTRSELILKQGHTAIALTREILCFPSNLAGFGFSPSRLAVKGLLMTNPGHVDPGSNGPLHLTIINMGKEDISLRTGDVIFTLLLIELSNPVQKNLSERQKGESVYQVKKLLKRLSYDFMSIEERALDIAKREVKREGLRIKIMQVLAPIIAAVIVATGTWLGIWSQHSKRVTNIEKSIAVLQEQLDNKDIKQRLKLLEKKIKEKN